jgi:hypothetical protein
MRVIRGRLLPSLALVAVACALVAGCGGGDESEANLPAPKGSPEQFAEQLAELLVKARAPQDCAPLRKIESRSFFQFQCPTSKQVRRSMAEFEVLEADNYGAGAVVDYKSGRAGDGASMVLFLSSNRLWSLTRFGIIAKESVGSDDSDNRAGFRKAVDGYLGAVRRRKCKDYMEYALTSSDQSTCRVQFPVTKPLGDALKANPKTEPEYLGGNGTFGFFGVETRKPKPAYRTISVIKTAPGSLQPYLVMDAVSTAKVIE